MIDTLLAATGPGPIETVTAAVGATAGSRTAWTPVLQIVQGTGALRVLAVVSTFLVSSLLGLVIAWKAYAGYAATRSTPMLFLALGIVLLTAVPALLSTILTNLSGLPGYSIVLVTNGAEILGLLAIAYSLYGEF